MPETSLNAHNSLDYITLGTQGGVVVRHGYYGTLSIYYILLFVLDYERKQSLAHV